MNEPTRLRLLQAARLSRLTDESTSMDKQDGEAQRYADAYGHEIIHACADTDVSGDTDPWSRPALGPWLTDADKIAQYDGIVAAHVDRLSRSTVDFMRLLKWADDTCGKCPKDKVKPEHVKRIITTGEQGIDFSTPVGKLLGYIISWLGEQELAAIKRRTQATFAWLRDNAYLTGKPPWGYKITTKDNHKAIIPDPALMRDGKHVLAIIVDKFVDGCTLTEICEWLESEGIRPATGEQWQQTTISGLLHNPVLIGQLESKGQIVRDNDGQPLQRCTPVITVETWKRLQAKLDAMPKRKSTAPKSTAMLTGVLFCGKCYGPMYLLTSTRKHRNGKTYVSVYYRCHGKPRQPSQCKNMIRQAEIEELINNYMVEDYGDVPEFEFTIIQGDDHGEQLAEVGKAIAELTAERYIRRIVRDDYDDLMARYQAEYGRLSVEPSEPERRIPRLTGETVRDTWPRRSEEEKREYLRGQDFRFFFHRNEEREPILIIEHPPTDKVLASLAGIMDEEYQAAQQVYVDALTREAQERAKRTAAE